MAKKKIQPKKYEQVDVLSAMSGKEDIVKDMSFIDDFTPSKKLDLFELLDDIRKNKTGSILDKEENLSSFNSFLIIQWLSMDHSEVPTLNYLNKYMTSMTKKQMYIALTHLIDKSHDRLNWIKKADDSDIEYIEILSKYFECSKKEASEYFSIIGKEGADKIKEKYGDAGR
jgi:hypothetical protein